MKKEAPVVPVSKDEKKRKYLDSKRSKSRLRRKVLLTGMAVLVSAAVVVVIVLVVFRISSIEVAGGSSYYSDDQIIAGSGLEYGSCMYLYKMNKISAKLTESLPYLGTVSIKRSLPETIVITVTDDTAAYAYAREGTYVLTDPSDKVLEYPCSSVPDGAVMVSGVDVVCTPVPGRPLMEVPAGVTLSKADQEANSAGVTSLALKNKIAQACAQYSLTSLTGIDVSDAYAVNAVIDGRFTLKLGTCSDLDYELKMAAQVIIKENDLHPGESVTIDLTMNGSAVIRRADSDDGTVTYRSEESTAESVSNKR